MCCKSLCSAGRIGYDCLITVPLCRYFSCFKVVATCTISALTARFGASGGFGLRPCAHIVTEGCNRVLCYEYFTALGALLALRQTCFGAGGLYSFKNCNFPTAVVVVECCDGGRFKRVAVLAIAAFFALLRLGGSFGFIPLAEAVTCCADVCVNVAVAAG